MYMYSMHEVNHATWIKIKIRPTSLELIPRHDINLATKYSLKTFVKAINIMENPVQIWLCSVRMSQILKYVAWLEVGGMYSLWL